MSEGGGTDSPHPRGWTRHARRNRGAGAGFPAPAGMDPRFRWSSRAWGGIPRTRGDGPPCFFRMALASADSPHPRGWTAR